MGIMSRKECRICLGKCTPAMHQAGLRIRKYLLEQCLPRPIQKVKPPVVKSKIIQREWGMNGEEVQAVKKAYKAKQNANIRA